MRKILIETRVKKLDEKKMPVYTEDNDGQEIQVYETIQCYLHHWGLQFETWNDGEGKQLVGQYTVAVVEDIETGQIYTFMPTEIKVLGSTTYG